MFRRVAIIGVGHSKFGVRQDVNVNELAFESIKPAIEDAGVDKRDIELMVLGSIGVWYEEPLPAVSIAEYCGLSGVGLLRTEAACATGSAAFFTAYSAIASGQIDVALVVGVEKMREVDTITAIELMGRAGCYLWEFHNFGVTFPAYYALHATAHMAKYGTTEEDLALIAVKNHKYAAMNPNAQFRKPITIDDVLSSMVIAWPLKLYDCCPITDGSATIVLASEDRVREFKIDTPIWIAGLGYSSDTINLSKRSSYVGLYPTVKASQMAYRMANIEPKDIELASVHDCFTIAELMAYEDLGFCKKGEGVKLIREGEVEVNGKIPVNIDGGLKAKGHPIGATGTSMIAELTKQLRGEAIERSRQVTFRKYIALAHNVGGTGHYCYVTILRR
ncbi:MAG: thiolase domain-containing protein [Candidatus Methanomethylicia archaeon]